MNEANENRIQVSQEDLPTLSFMPIWVYHSVCRAALSPQRIDKRSLILALETYTEQEFQGVTGFLLGFLKYNLHKLVEHHYGDVDQPDFAALDSDLVQAIDLLQTSAIEQPAFHEYQQFLRGFALQVAEQPKVQGTLETYELTKLRSQALLLQRMLS